LKVRKYEEFVAAGAFMPIDDDAYSVIGLCGEAGEVAEWVKKAQFRGNKKFTEDMLKLELGDVLHYVTRMALNHDWTLKELMDANSEKLMGRKDVALSVAANS
jgi:NTP pyrophosphatase (non-canonical NTP hydrolase)